MFKKENEENERLLPCCMRGRFDEEVRRQIVNLLEEKIDWEDFIDEARYHGIAASAYLHFKQLDKGIPEGAKNRLHKMYLWNVTHNLKLIASSKPSSKN